MTYICVAELRLEGSGKSPSNGANLHCFVGAWVSEPLGIVFFVVESAIFLGGEGSARLDEL